MGECSGFGNDLPWFPFYVHRFMGSRKVQRMDAAMVGGYLLLLIDQWNNGPIPQDDAARISKLDDAVAMRLLCDCFTETPDGWVNQALEDVRAEQEAKAQRLSRAGRKGARAKWSPEARTRREELERDWQEKLALVDGVCPRCAEATVRFDRDHIVPKHMGGADTPDNIQPLCAWCNSAKGTETVNWLQVYTQLRDSGAAIARLKQGRGKAIAIEEIREEKKEDVPAREPISTDLPPDIAASVSGMKHKGGITATRATIRQRFLLPDEEGMPDQSVIGLDPPTKAQLVAAALLEMRSQGVDTFSPRTLSSFVLRLRHAPPVNGDHPGQSAAEEQADIEAKREAARTRRVMHDRAEDDAARLAHERQRKAKAYYDAADDTTRARLDSLMAPSLHRFGSRPPALIVAAALVDAVERLNASTDAA